MSEQISLPSATTSEANNKSNSTTTIKINAAGQQQVKTSSSNPAPITTQPNSKIILNNDEHKQLSKQKCEKWTIYYAKEDGFRLEKEDLKNNRFLNNTVTSYLMPQEKLVSKDYVLGRKQQYVISKRREPVKSFKRKDLELEKKAEALIAKQIERYNAVYVVSNKTLKYSMEEDFSKEDISSWPSTTEKVRLFKSSKSNLDAKLIKKEHDEKMKAYEESLLHQEVKEEDTKPKYEIKKRIRFSNFANVARDRVEKVDKIVFNKSKKVKTDNAIVVEKINEDNSSDEDEDYDVSELSSCVVSYDSIIQFAKDAKERAEKRYNEELKDGIPLYDL
ncbi:predicted protein [Naegleria gruberi]|uniref:Predicted protein n=1 Tax=Naegleria gruberi TaxID=5762 RepID=D2V330_NAEGR|nr:uncharacterized protein NAEGRDRAFT_56976 [Naegleria gruberi]EFC48561.1 predicted protein [Naegleria gruberi]|eukprot:XP_002681305.1 predicted protein [Naegleria gruberi strain NEG-M]